MKYLVTLYKGEPLTITQDEFNFIGRVKTQKKDSFFLKGRLVGTGNVADISPIKEDYIPDRLALSEKSQGTPLTPERFKELNEKFSNMYKHNK